jgi:glycine dehydrogenase subunit 1
MSYIANTDKDRQDMLDFIGVKSFKDLISNIPQHLLLKEGYDLSQPLSELEINKLVNKTLSKNKCLNQLNSFLGAGVYDHFIPAAVDNIIGRPEFLTAYTPYQAEVSQGTLQGIYEYQTLICELTGMDISNAGMYDGASATAEAILMACRKNRLMKVLIPYSINPLYYQVIKSYIEGVGIEIEFIPMKDGVTDLEKLAEIIDEKTCAVVVQTPNFFGCLEDMFEIEKVIRTQKKPLFIAVADPISLGALNAPIEYNADIVCGEGQSLGNKPFYGGPLMGFLACKMELSRNMPGRIVGQTTDADGNRCYSLTLQTREQHIRRDKATSNICSNQALCTLASTVYMCMLGKQGMKEVAELSATKAHYLAREIEKIPGFSLAFKQPFFREFTINTPIPAINIIAQLQDMNILPGVPLTEAGMENSLLIAVTEKKSKSEMDELVSALREVVQ